MLITGEIKPMAQSTNTIAPSPEGGNRLLSNDTSAPEEPSQIGTTDTSAVKVQVAVLHTETLRRARLAFVPGERNESVKKIRAATRSAQGAFAATMALIREEIAEYVVGESSEDVANLLELPGAKEEAVAFVEHIEHLVARLDSLDAVCAFHQSCAATPTMPFSDARGEAAQLVDLIAYVSSKETGEIYDETDATDVKGTARNREIARAFMLRRIAELRAEIGAVKA